MHPGTIETQSLFLDAPVAVHPKEHGAVSSHEWLSQGSTFHFDIQGHAVVRVYRPMNSHMASTVVSCGSIYMHIPDAFLPLWRPPTHTLEVLNRASGNERTSVVAEGF